MCSYEAGQRNRRDISVFLEIGNQQRIDDPTPEQIGYWLRNLPAEAPFLILNADNEQFLQATPWGLDWRVEWRQEAEQRFMRVGIERAEVAFAAFQRWDEAALRCFPWKRLTVFNDPHRRLIFVVAALAIIALAGLWSALR